MKDLFASEVQFTPTQMPDADVHFLTRLPMPQQNESILRRLRDETVWLHEKVMVWGKEHYQPRLTAWYADPGKSYTYSGTVMHPLPWTSLLLSLKREIELLTDARFNSVLLNLYRDQNDRMGFHSDNEPSLGKEPTIASLSYGATRTLIFKHKKVPELSRKRVQLTSGSLLLMGGKTQQNWAHGIDKESRPCGPRGACSHISGVSRKGFSPSSTPRGHLIESLLSMQSRCVLSRLTFVECLITSLAVASALKALREK